MDIIKQILPGKPEYVSLVRLSVTSIANQMGFSIEEIEDFKVAVSEACTNVILYGLKDENSHYEVVFKVEESTLSISVTDNGKGFDPKSIKMPDLMGNQVGGGFGLYIIKSLMDHVEINSEEGTGTSITMVKNLLITNEV